MKRILTAIALLALAVSCGPKDQVSLAGKWQVSLDSLATFQPIDLPGTTDAAGLGEPNTLEPALKLPQLQSLRRKNSFIGEAFYKRSINIPSSLAGKPLEITLERVIWQSSVWIDGVQLEGAEESLTTAHHYQIPEGLASGKHEVMIRIDNRKRYDISRNELAHAYTNDTQIKWNGILGEMSIKALAPVEVAHVDIYPVASTMSAKIVATLVRTDASKSSVKVKFSTDCGGTVTKDVELGDGATVVELPYEFKSDAALWDEFNPALHKLTVQCAGDSKTVTFGIRDFKANGNHMEINGRRIFLRGTLDCCIFPLTGTPPTDEAGWEKVFNTCKAWGLNHIRFHSYCPPDAAFRVADRMGFYLQPELPIWSSATVYENVQNFLMAETDRILADYGNHPSFCMFSGGNELNAGYDYLNEWLRYIKAKDPRHLYTNATYTMGGEYKGHPIEEDQYFVASRSNLGQVRGQDYMDKTVPNFITDDYTRTAIDQGVPMISHEVGQLSVYPHIAEIEKYTGVLEPLNFISVREDLRAKGRLDKAEDYTMASGRLSAILYKEEVERALKTPGLSGFQLLGLQDFPGQATALVGLVDSFWDNKGLVTEEWFRQACSPVTPLARFEKAVWTSDETFKAGIEVANFWKEDIDKELVWKVLQDKKVIAEGSVKANLPVGRNTKVKEVASASLASIEKASKLKLEISVKGTEWKNSWDFWVYPAGYTPDYGEVTVTRDYDEALAALQEGKKVLLNPKAADVKGSAGKFVPVFWSPVFFANEAGTMGILCDPKHPALADFPTEMHSNWQWWTLAKHSKALYLDDVKGVTPILEAVDNFGSNRALAYLFETACEGGRLMVCSMDLLGEQDANNPEVKQLLGSVLDYMNSAAFAPKEKLDKDALKGFFYTEEELEAMRRPFFGFGFGGAFPAGMAPRRPANNNQANYAGIRSNQ